MKKEKNMKKKKVVAIFIIAAGAIAACYGCSHMTYEYEDENIRIIQYTGVESGVFAPVSITEADVEAEIENILEEHADVVETGLPAKEGNIAVVDYTGYIDGKAFDGGTAEGMEVSVGDTDFSKSVIGHKQGETYEWTGSITNSGDYNSVEADGEAVYTITIKAVAEKQMPELTDTFVKNLSEISENVQEYREEIKKRLEEQSETEYKRELSAGVFDAVLQNTEVFEYPAHDLKEAVKRIEQQYRSAAFDGGVEYTVFLSDYMGYSEGEFEEEVETAAKAQVKENLVIHAIADKEGILQTEKGKKAALKAMAEDYGYNSVQDMYAEIGKDEAEQYALAEAVKEWLAEQSE